MDISGSIIALLATVGTKIIAALVNFFTQAKVFWLSLLTVLIPVLINNVIGGFIQEALDIMQTLGVDAEWGNVAEFTGFLGWLVDCFQIPEFMAIVLAAVSLHLVLKMIPFSPVK
jgi:hypothetical protein